MDSAELAEWMAYESLEPWGEQRADLRMGNICATFANCNLKKGARPFKASDFIPKFGPVMQQTPDEMKKLLMGLVEASKDKVKK